MPSLLIVDDQRDLLLLLHHVFTAGGYQVASAASGAEALDVSKEQDFDLAIVDWQMPGLDGVEVCRLLLQQAETRQKRIGVWLMTGATIELVEPLAAEIPIRGIFAKPLNPARLMKIFQEYLDSRPPKIDPSVNVPPVDVPFAIPPPTATAPPEPSSTIRTQV